MNASLRAYFADHCTGECCSASRLDSGSTPGSGYLPRRATAGFPGYGFGASCFASRSAIFSWYSASALTYAAVRA